MNIECVKPDWNATLTFSTSWWKFAIINLSVKYYSICLKSTIELI